jgi:hypothetical protein
VLVIDAIREGDERFVPSVVARLVAPDEQDRTAPGIKSVRLAGLARVSLFSANNARQGKAVITWIRAAIPPSG